jgi:uroporphyrinogen decarboxylase
MKEAHGRTVGIHVCGKSKKLWKKAAETGFSLFSVDNIEDLEEICSEIGSSTTILGNVDPVDVLLRGTVRDVYSEAEICIKKARNSKKGFILGSGCEIPPHTPKENIQALMDAARIFGRMQGEDAAG